jgi:hypothetical protein
MLLLSNRVKKQGIVFDSANKRVILNDRCHFVPVEFNKRFLFRLRLSFTPTMQRKLRVTLSSLESSTLHLPWTQRREMITSSWLQTCVEVWVV